MGTALAASAGVLVGPTTTTFQPIDEGIWTLYAFVVVILGGLGTFRGTVYAGVLVGMVDAVMTWWYVNAVRFTGLPEMTVFLLLVLVLIVKPQGMFGVEEVGGH